jgi:hypothetical protein
VVRKVAADNIANSRISKRIDVGDDFLAVFMANFQGSKTMLEQDPPTDDGSFLGNLAKFV